MAITIGLSLKEKKKIFEVCSLIRLTELEISKRYTENKMRCPVHLSVGQEGAPAVLSLLLKKEILLLAHISRMHTIYAKVAV